MDGRDPSRGPSDSTDCHKEKFPSEVTWSESESRPFHPCKSRTPTFSDFSRALIPLPEENSAAADAWTGMYSTTAGAT